MGVTFNSKGDWNLTLNFLKKNRDTEFISILRKYGKQGVTALSDATPKDTGLTASSWSYEIWTNGRGDYKLYWTNSNMAEPGMPIAVLLQYGHATRHGTYVQGIDYINPALKPIFEKMANDIWGEVNS